MIGQRQMLDRAQLIEHAKAQGLDFSKLFYKPTPWPGDTIYRSIEQDHEERSTCWIAGDRRSQ